MTNNLTQPLLQLFLISISFTLLSLDARAAEHSYVPASLSFAKPVGGLQEAFNAKPSLGFSLGYELGLDRHWAIGLHGTWTRMALGEVDTSDYSNFGITHVGIMASVKFKFIKHGFTPYLRAEGGMGYLFADEVIGNAPVKIDGLDDLKLSIGACAGVQIPVSGSVDVDVYARYFTTFVARGFGSIGGHVGMVYTLPR